MQDLVILVLVWGSVDRRGKWLVQRKLDFGFLNFMKCGCSLDGFVRQNRFKRRKTGLCSETVLVALCTLYALRLVFPDHRFREFDKYGIT